MYHVSAQGVDERMINVHNYYYYRSVDHDVRRSVDRNVPRSIDHDVCRSIDHDVCRYIDHDNGSPRMRVDR